MKTVNAPHDAANAQNCALFMIPDRVSGTSAYARWPVLGQVTFANTPPSLDLGYAAASLTSHLVRGFGNDDAIGREGCDFVGAEASCLQDLLIMFAQRWRWCERANRRG